jgi:hypothetical protein
LQNNEQGPGHTGSSKAGRNASCPCGSGRKYKRCCGSAQAIADRAALPPGRFRYEAASYGLREGLCVPSILCSKEADDGTWKPHFILVNPADACDRSDHARDAAEAHLAAARGRHHQDGILAFAAALKAVGYVRVDDPAPVPSNIMEAAAYIQQCAAGFRPEVRTFGDWILFSAQCGDAWLLDPEESLAVCLALHGQAQHGKVVEEPERYYIDFEARYRIEGDAFVFGHPDGPEHCVPGYPVEHIRKAGRRHRGRRRARRST